jgi:hypothetical protein
MLVDWFGQKRSANRRSLDCARISVPPMFPLYAIHEIYLWQLNVERQIMSNPRIGLKHGSLVIQDGVLHSRQTDALSSEKSLLSRRITVVNGNFRARVYISHDRRPRL